MSTTGCTNPKAVNYDPSSDQDDGSCVYLHKVGGVCYAFQDYGGDPEDQSFTVSLSVEGNSWVFYHDYIPDFYFSTRKQLYSLESKAIWKHNRGPRGMFYKTSVSPFFIDIVFKFASNVLLNSVQWISQVVDNLGKTHQYKTFTHITVWNDFQCTGRLPISEYVPLQPEGVQRNLSEFSWNDLRDIVKDHGEFFMKSVFEDIRPDSTTLDTTLPWYEMAYMQNSYFVIRLEFDNTEDKSVSLHSVDATVDQHLR